MKDIIVRIAIIFSLTLAMMAAIAFQGRAAEVKLGWDNVSTAADLQSVRIYERQPDGTWVMVGEAHVDADGNAPTQITLKDVAPGVHTYMARSYNGEWESEDSNTMSTKPQPGAPKLTIVTVTTVVITQ